MRRIWSLVLLLPNETLGTQALLQLHTFISKTVTYSIGSFHVCFSCGLGSSRSPSTAYGGQLLRRREVVSTRSFCNSCPLFMVGIWRDDIFQGKWDSNRNLTQDEFLAKVKGGWCVCQKDILLSSFGVRAWEVCGLVLDWDRVLTWSRKTLPGLASAMEMCTLAEARKRSGGAWVCRLPCMQSSEINWDSYEAGSQHHRCVEMEGKWNSCCVLLSLSDELSLCSQEPVSLQFL